MSIRITKKVIWPYKVPLPRQIIFKQNPLEINKNLSSLKELDIRCFRESNTDPLFVRVKYGKNSIFIIPNFNQNTGEFLKKIKEKSEIKSSLLINQNINVEGEFQSQILYDISPEYIFFNEGYSEKNTYIGSSHHHKDAAVKYFTNKSFTGEWKNPLKEELHFFAYKINRDISRRYVNNFPENRNKSSTSYPIGWNDNQDRIYKHFSGDGITDGFISEENKHYNERIEETIEEALKGINTTQTIFFYDYDNVKYGLALTNLPMYSTYTQGSTVFSWSKDSPDVEIDAYDYLNSYNADTGQDDITKPQGRMLENIKIGRLSLNNIGMSHKGLSSDPQGTLSATAKFMVFFLIGGAVSPTLARAEELLFKIIDNVSKFIDNKSENSKQFNYSAHEDGKKTLHSK